MIKSWPGAALVAAEYMSKSDSEYYIGLNRDWNPHQSTNPCPHPTIVGQRVGSETRPNSDRRDPNRKFCLKLKTHQGWPEIPILLI
jgi:hypothetical protein